MQTKCGCSKYSKTVEEIADAASKHRDKLVTLKEVAEAQKEKIFCLRGHRNELFEEIDNMNSKHDNEIKESNKKLSSLQEDNDSLKEQLSDQKEELEMLKLRDIEELNEKVVNVLEPSLADELELATENLEKEDLKKDFNALKTKLKKLEENKDEKKTLLEHLLELSNQRTELS